MTDRDRRVLLACALVGLVTAAWAAVAIPARATYGERTTADEPQYLLSALSLAEDRDHLDALVACFPAGTVSGAPKIRAMQILASLEPTRREVYAGAVGYLDFAGNLDFCIAIRTITIRGGRARLQAGAGIVADSNPAAEYEETRDKARALLQALAMAEAGL